MQPLEQLTKAGHRRRCRQWAGLTPRNSSSGGNNSSSRVAEGRQNKATNSFQVLCSLVLVVAAVVFPSASFGEARDTSTVSGGYQHTCIVTADANVKVR